MKYLAIVIAMSLAVSGCSSGTKQLQSKQIVIKNVASKPVDFNPPPIDPFNPRPVEWIVVTPDNIDEVWKKLEKTGEPLVLFAVTEKGYQNISINNRESLRVILQQKQLIKSFKKVYIRAKKNDE